MEMSSCKNAETFSSAFSCRAEKNMDTSQENVMKCELFKQVGACSWAAIEISMVIEVNDKTVTAPVFTTARIHQIDILLVT